MEVSHDVSYMVRSWLQASPTASSKVFVRVGSDDGAASPFTPRPERLGLGASLPSNHKELTRKKMVALRIQRKITGRKRKENNREEPGGYSVVAVDLSDDECSKAASVSSRKFLQANLLPQSKNRKKRKRRKRHVESTTNTKDASGARCALLRTPHKRELLLGGSQLQGPGEVNFVVTEESSRPGHSVNGLECKASSVPSSQLPASSSHLKTTPHRLREQPGNHRHIPTDQRSPNLVVEQTTPVRSSTPSHDPDFRETVMTSHTGEAAPAPLDSPLGRSTHLQQSGRKSTDPLLSIAAGSGMCARGSMSRADCLDTQREKHRDKKSVCQQGRRRRRKFQTYRSLARYLAVRQKPRHPALLRYW